MIGEPLSEFKGMWLFILFDLPVKTKKQRRNYTQFRTELLKFGFSQLQFSIYVRYFRGQDASKSYRQKIHGYIPPNGKVRLLTVTDHQFGKMQNFIGKIEQDVEKPPNQMLLF